MRTKRLLIRPIENRDFDDLWEYARDQETGKYTMYWPKTRQELKAFIHRGVLEASAKNPDWLEFVIVLMDSQKVIGNISLELSGGEGEIGWVSNKKYWNRGYMTEAVGAVIKHCLETPGVGKIRATCTDQNAASYKIMEKCGMKRVRTEKNCKGVKQGKEVVYNKLTYEITKVPGMNEG